VPVLMLTVPSEEMDRVPLDLTRTEFELLHFLLRNPGWAFGRSYLLDAVWGEHYVAGDRSVDNAVLRLRRHQIALLRRVGALVESPALYPNLTGRENLEVTRRHTQGGK
jgi:ABC-type uncharacterized transport system ATPase subunit